MYYSVRIAILDNSVDNSILKTLLFDIDSLAFLKNRIVSSSLTFLFEFLILILPKFYRRNA